MNIDKDARIPLGIGRLIGQSLSHFFSNLRIYFGIAFLPVFALGLATTALTGGVLDPGAVPASAWGAVAPFVLATIVAILFGIAITALLTLAAYDLISGRPVQIGHYVRQTLRCLLPLLVLGVAVTVAFLIGMMLLLIPGIYIAARYCAMTPAIVVEQADWGAMGRASELSRSYRWPLAGLVVAFALVTILLSTLFEMAAGLAFFGSFTVAEPSIVPMSLTSPMAVLAVGLQSAGSVIAYGLWAVVTALVYARLREIKEGVGIDDIDEVFG